MGQKQKTEKNASTHGARKLPGPKRKKEEERTMTKTMASYALQRHLWWRTQSRLGQKEKEREKERLNNGDNNGQATHGARKHAWRTQKVGPLLQKLGGYR